MKDRKWWGERGEEGKTAVQQHSTTMHVCFSNVYIQHQYNKRVSAKRETRLVEGINKDGMDALLESLKVLAWVLARHTQNQIHLRVRNHSKSQDKTTTEAHIITGWVVIKTYTGVLFV